jgi:hypothetical protein
MRFNWLIWQQNWKSGTTKYLRDEDDEEVLSYRLLCLFPLVSES